jgi:hypothetical protein
VGTIALYNAAGTVITTGSINDAPLAAYAVASTTVRAGDARALLQAAQPNPSGNIQTWNRDQLSSLTAYPPATGPADITGSTHPIVTGSSGDLTLNDFIQEFPNTDPSGIGCAYAGTPAGCTNTSYQNIYQLRLKTVNTAGVQTDNYAVADLLVNGTTWTQVYPVATTPTTTALAVTPASSASQGASVTLTATESLSSDSTNHPAGTVQFKDGTTNVGTPQTVNASGVATLTTATLPPSAPSGAKLTAVFSPTNSTIGGSTSNVVSYTVNPVAKKPTITGTVQAGKTLTCKETTTSGETATYVWEASGKKIASGKTLSVPGTAVGKTLTCSATVKVGGGKASTATSAATKKVARGAALKATKKPKLSGSGKVGKTEKVNHGKWSPAASSYTYQWYVGSSKIKGAHKSSYKLISKDKGKKVSCKVTAKKTGFASGSAKTKSVKVKS